ncbi:hypothetical protein [Deinococcus sedimenti]|nr:hypothetical protein [Deinococcus sedimenti]
MTRTLILPVLAALSLSACGSVGTPEMGRATLHAQEDCPSCGIMPVTVDPQEFWAWSDTLSAPQVWAYGAARVNGGVREVLVNPVSQPVALEPAAARMTGGVWFDRPLACLNTADGDLTMERWGRPTLRTTEAVAAAALTGRGAAERTCLDQFGPGWAPLTDSQPNLIDSELVWAAGRWVVDTRKAQAGVEW